MAKQTRALLLAAVLAAAVPWSTLAAGAEASRRRAEAGAQAQAQRHGFGAKQESSFK